MEEQSRSMKRNHVPKGPREEVAVEGAAVVAAADLEEDEAAGAVVAAAAVVAVAADHKAGVDEVAVRVIDSNRSVLIHCDPLLNRYGNR
jgi:hypothetical protein